MRMNVYLQNKNVPATHSHCAAMNVYACVYVWRVYIYGAQRKNTMPSAMRFRRNIRRQHKRLQYYIMSW